MAGHVLVNDEPIQKPGEKVALESEIRLKVPELKYVSRGALKIIAALDHFNIHVQGQVAVDVGASTGGFTEVLLERGAQKVYALDVGTNQLAWRLRSDPRVISREHYNVRHFLPTDFPEKFEVLVMDVSFISIRLLLTPLIPGMKPGSHFLVLFKPQFELGKQWIGEGGIVHDQEQALRHLQDILLWAEEIGLKSQGWIPSPITGTDGNQEYLIHWVLRS